MKIDIDLNEEQCMRLLEKQGYKTEDVLLYYNPSTSPYNNNEDCPVDQLRGIEYKVAYPIGDKPRELNKEYPLLEDCSHLVYGNVVNELFMRILVDKIF